MVQRAAPSVCCRNRPATFSCCSFSFSQLTWDTFPFRSRKIGFRCDFLAEEYRDEVGSTLFEGTTPECDIGGVGGDHRTVRPSGHPETGMGMEGVLVVAEVASSQTVSWWGRLARRS